MAGEHIFLTIDEAIYPLIGAALEVGLAASVLLLWACLLRRIMMAGRTHRWIKAVAEAKADGTSIYLTGSLPGPPAAPVAVRDHVVQFYDEEQELVTRVTGFVAAALRAREVAVVVATEDHRRAFEAALDDDGIDIAAAQDDGMYIPLDAAKTMSQFIIDGNANRVLFHSVVGGLMRRAIETGRPVRAYGEMVALLWEDGHVNTAIQLEALWNELGSLLAFSLFCAYPKDLVAATEHVAELRTVCDQHSSIVR